MGRLILFISFRVVSASFEKGLVRLLALLGGDVLFLHARKIVSLLDGAAALVSTDPRA